MIRSAQNLNLIFTLFACAAAVLFIAGCTYSNSEFRAETARRLASPVFMQDRIIPTEAFHIQAYERVYAVGKPANLYIEGDGLVWIGHDAPQSNPSPRNPVSLHLASRDNGANVIHLARPCQYVDLDAEPSCHSIMWTTDRYSEFAVHTMNQAIDNVKRRYNIPEFHLIGHGGGGAMVTLVARLRNDVASIRTVSGILDHDAWTHMKDVDPLVNSLNPIYAAQDIASIPQHHFIGAVDDNVTPDLFWRFYEASLKSPCIKATIAQNSDHDGGWVDKWHELLKEPLNCNGMMQ